MNSSFNQRKLSLRELIWKVWEQVGDAQWIMGRMLTFHLLRWNG